MARELAFALDMEATGWRRRRSISRMFFLTNKSYHSDNA
jgi:hypothetical protein